MNRVAQFWIFFAGVFGVFLFLEWQVAANPRMVFFPFFAMLLLVAGARWFRCPHCKNPIMKRRTTENPLGYEWRVPTSRVCSNCGARL